MSRDPKQGRSSLISAAARGAGALALGSTLLLSGCFGESAQDLLTSAKAHLAKKDQKAAIIQLKNALQKDATLAEARFLLARALLDAGDVAGAGIEADKAKEQGYAGDGLVALQARLLLMQGKPLDVIKTYGDRHLATAADEADLQSTLVGAFVTQRDLAKARVAADAALKATPQDTTVRLVNVRLLAAEGKLAEARAEVDKVTGGNAASAEAWQLKGELAVLAEAPQAEVVEDFRKAVALDKRLPGAHAGLVNALMRGNDKKGAREALAAMKAALPNHPQTLYFGAVFALEDRDLKQATELVQSLLKLTPDNERSLFLAGRVAESNGDLRQAESHYAKVVQAAPAFTQARVALARVQSRGDLDQAMATLQPVLDGKDGKDGAYAEALSLAAEINLKQGHGDKAQALLGRAVDANPGDVRSRVSLALAQIDKGQEAAGVAELRKIAETDKTGASDMALISTLMRRKDWDGALKAIDQLDKKRPDAATAPELRGRIALARNDRAGARKQFEEAQKREPAVLQPALNLAAMDVQDGKPEDASGRFDVTLKADPKNVRAHMAQIGVRMNAKLMTRDQAQERLTELVRTQPNEVAPRLGLISLLMEKKDAKQARSVAQEGVTANPDQVDLLDALGQVQQAQGDRQQAIASFNKITTLQPRSPLGPLRLTDLYMAAGDRDQAVNSLKRAMAAAPGDAELAEKATAKALQLGRPELALQAAKSLQTARPTVPLGWKLEGDAARARKDWPVAIAAYKRAEQMAASQPAQNGNLAIALHGSLVESGKTDEAARYASAWTAKFPRDVMFRYHLGDVALAKSDYAQASRWYQDVLTQDPNNAAAANNLAWLKLRTGQKDEALKFAEQANKLRPDVPPYMDTMAEVLAARGDTAKAVQLQKTVVDRAPDVPVYRLRLAQLYVAGGQKAEAQTELKRLTDLGPKFEQQAEVQKLQAAIR